MARSSKILLSLIVGIAVALVFAVGWCWKIRQTEESRSAALQEVETAMREVQDGDVVNYLNRLASERFFHTWFDRKLPYLHVAWETKVPLDVIGKYAADALRRFSKGNVSNAEYVPRLKQLTYFAESLLPNRLSGDVANVLRERLRYANNRLLGVYFLSGDFDSIVAMSKKVLPDDIAWRTEEAFLHFSGNGEPNSEDVPRLKQLIGFAESFLAGNQLSEDAANALSERLLDAHFLIGDFDGAIAMLEKGLPGRDKDWATATVAKLRAHRAMDIAAKPGQDAETVKKAKREALENFVVFGEYMLSPAMEKFEDCDPTTGVIYSFEWVAVKNFMRSAVLAREIGDTAKADELTARAKKYVESARKKAKEDKKSFDVFQAEMKTYGL